MTWEVRSKFPVVFGRFDNTRALPQPPPRLRLSLRVALRQVAVRAPAENREYRQRLPQCGAVGSRRSFKSFKQMAASRTFVAGLLSVKPSFRPSFATSNFLAGEEERKHILPLLSFSVAEKTIGSWQPTGFVVSFQICFFCFFLRLFASRTSTCAENVFNGFHLFARTWLRRGRVPKPCSGGKARIARYSFVWDGLDGCHLIALPFFEVLKKRRLRGGPGDSCGSASLCLSYPCDPEIGKLQATFG